MDSHQVSFKRIAFRIDPYVYQSFEDRANELKLTKAKLLRDWLTQALPSLTQIVIPSNKRSRSYNVFIAVELYEEIMVAAKTLNTSYSNVISTVIQNHLRQSSVYTSKEDSVTTTRNDFWRGGDLVNFHLYLQNDWTQMSIPNLLSLARCAVETGNLREANQLIDFLAAKKIVGSQYLTLKAYIHLLKARMGIYLEEYSTVAQEASMAIYLGSQLNNRDILGHAHLINALAYMRREDINASIRSFDQVLEFLDIMRHPILIMEAYLGLARVHSLTVQVERTQAYLDRVGEILKNNPHPVIHSLWEYEQGLLQLIHFQNRDKARNFLHNSLTAAISINSKVRKLYAYEGLAALNMFEGKIDQAFKYTNAAKSQRREMSDTPAELTVANFLGELLSPTVAHLQGSKYLNRAMEISQFTNQRQDFYNYLYHARRFELGRDEDSRSQLIRLADSGTYSRVRESAQQTLQDGIMTIVR